MCHLNILLLYLFLFCFFAAKICILQLLNLKIPKLSSLFLDFGFKICWMDKEHMISSELQTWHFEDGFETKNLDLMFKNEKEMFFVC